MWLDNDTREEGEGRVNIEDVKETTMYMFQRSIRWYSRWIYIREETPHGVLDFLGLPNKVASQKIAWATKKGNSGDWP